MSYFLIFIFVFSVIVYVYFKYTTYKYTKLFDTVRLNNTTNLSISNLYLPSSVKGLQASYTFDIVIPNISENSSVLNSSYSYDKFILSRHNSPGFYYNIKSNKMKIYMKYKVNNILKTYILEINGDKLKNQKMVSICLVINNKKLNFYINQLLHKSVIMPNVPYLFERNINVGQKNNNFNTIIKNGKYFNRALKQKEINDLL
jgi:hypothetical protein